MGSWLRSGVLVAVVVSAALSGSRTLAQEAAQAPAPEAEASAEEDPAEAAAPVGDPKHGKAISNTCLGCHGVPGYKNAYPNYSVPKLEGQHAEYITMALKAYRSGERSHMTMHSQAASLSDQDMADVAAFFAGTPIKPSDAPEGTEPAASATCVACHGKDGVGIVGMYPTLSGQHADYLERALMDYKKGGRKNPIMTTFAAMLSDEDIRQLARYYAQQQPALHTIERPYTVLTAER